MKNKSGNHKSTNRFKFISFADRVSTIDIRRSALYHLEHVNIDNPEENETYFHNALVRWKVLNLTNEYVNFSKPLENIVTLPQLLHRKDDVINALITNLQAANILNLQPLLELVVVLARDLQDDFYNCFPKFLDCLIKLLNTKDPEQLEWTLICLAFLFKYLRVYLKKDITIVLKSILPLLSETTKWYVRNFAAESFAFVARDAKDKKKFVETLVKTVDSNKNTTVGCGHLLFEVIRGVGGQFHSCTSVFLPLYFNTLQDKNINQDVLFEIITQAQGDMLESIHPKFGELYWNTIIECVQLFFNNKSDSKSAWTLKEENIGLEYTLRLIGQALEHGRGKFLTNPLPVLNLIHNLIGANLSEATSKITSQIGILTILCSHINLPHENAVYLVKRLLSLPYSDIVTNFVEEVVSSPSFDIIVFPHFIDTINTFDSGVIRALSKICLSKSPLCKNGSDLYTWVKYPIDFGQKINAYQNSFIEIFDKDLVRILESPDDCMCVLITLPHIKNLNLDDVKRALKDFILNLIMYLKNVQENNDSTIRNILLLMAIAIESAIHIMSSENLDTICPMNEMIDVIEPYLTDHRFLCSLRILDLMLTIKESEHILNYDVLLKIHPTIEKNLMSPYHEIRLLTTHIYSLFEMILPEHATNKNDSLNASLKQKESFKMFSLCHAAEALSLSVENYREQLLKLSKTVYDSIQYKLGSNVVSNKFSLQFMLGFLNVNFKLIWEPLQGLILTYANGLPPNEFWEIFHPCLIRATENVRNGDVSSVAYGNFMGKLTFLDNVFKEYYDLPEKPDFISYRIHLWEILYQAPALCVIKNRDVTISFLDFLNMEFEKPQYICNHADSVTNAIKMSVDDDEYVDENDVTNNEEDDDNKKSAVTKYTYDTLIAHLKIYSTIQNPKALFSEQKLYTIYLEFLMHKNPVVQKVALDCIMKYKNKHWTPYKDQLYNLVDGKKFKDELRSFKIETDSEIIAADDRHDLMPILLRIAYSKMVTNTGIDKKGGSQMRRSLVMRFISGCTENELLIFTDMAFKGFVEYIDLDLNSMYDKIMSYDDYATFLVPKKIFGSLNLVENMREQFIKPGELLLLPKLMKILFCIGTFLKKVLSNESELKPGYVSILKNIRNTCITSIANFFKQFDQWEWNEDEILYTCNIFIWPILERLPIEGIHSPTALLKLFNVWSQNPRYHNLFTVCCRIQNDKTPLPFILKLLSNNKINRSVYEVCMQIVERLLTLENEEDTTITITENNCIPLNNVIVKQLDLKEKLNVGSCALLPHISAIVTILKDKYVKINPKKLQKRDLIILARITEMVYESESIDLLLKFLLPILIQRIAISSTEDSFESSVEALTKLLSKTTEPKNHVKTIVPLFSKVVTARARKQLCESLSILATLSDTENDKSLSITAKLISDMNASDEKWLEQPDFDRRLDAFKTINKMCDEDSISVELGALIVHNSFFTISHSNDISLRSNASASLQKIVPKLIVKYKDNDFFVHDTVLNLINDGVKNDGENLKMESIALLGELVRECPDTLPIFKDLHPLSNKKDKEIDFFENLQHIQIHRKTRALLKFCNHVKTSSNVPSSKTLTRFIIPLASQYICAEKYVEKSSLVEAAIDTIGIICRLLPWHQYELVLKYYINKLHNSIEHQKQLVKIISGILDAFHFDLSKATNLDEVMKNAMLPKELRGEAKKNLLVNNTNKIEEMVVQENEEAAVNLEILPYERIIALSPSAAKRVIFTICSDILVQLNWNSAQITEHETLHKSLRKVGSNAREADEKLRIPMGLAIVKLLQKLPQPMLDHNILSILIKVCNFLKSPLVNVRASAREILTKIMQSVGTKYFNLLLNHMSTLLTRGTQVHVLILTVHTILEALQDMFAPKEMDKYFENILKVCLNDLFGLASEEKEVVKLGNKAPEAKPSKKSFLTLKIIAQNIGDSSIVDLLKPFKTVVEKTHSKRVVLKVETCFQYLSLGLVNNTNMSTESSLIFLCGILSDSIPKLSSKKKVIASEIVSLEEPKPKRNDCFIIAPNPRGSKKIPRKLIACSSQQSNSHVITEFGLNMLYAVLQKDNVTNVDIRPYLDPMITFIIDACKSSQVKVSTLGLKCITSIWSKRIILPEIKAKIEDTITAIFEILHKYATSGLSKKDENFHLVANAFKATTSLIRHVQYYTLDLDHVKTLLMYAEHDIHDHERQATAFSLLKAIISAKYKLVEIKTIVKKIREITITSESPRARDEAGQVISLYLLNYCLPKEIKQNIQFYTTQLEYELDHGRISAIKILQYVVENFPEDVLVIHAPFLFVTVGMRLVNETNLECKNLIATCLEKLLKKISNTNRNELFETALIILSDTKPSHIELGARLSSRFVHIENDKFQSRLCAILPKISDILAGGIQNGGQFVRISSNEDSHLNKDSSYIQILKSLNLMGENCPIIFTDVQYQSTIEEICYNCQSLLAHNNSFVRLNAVKFLSQYLQSLNPQRVYKSIQGQINAEISFAHTVDSLKSLVLDLSSQLIPGEISEELASAVCKNLVVLLKMLNDFPIKDYSKESEEENYINVDWVIKKVKSAINGEVAKSPSIVVVRMAAFGMLEELCNILNDTNLIRTTMLLMSCILREMSKTDTSFDNIKNKATTTSSLLNEKLGNDVYNSIMSKSQARLVTKRKERKMKEAQNKVNNPERAAKRKLVLKDKKREYKKKKIDRMRGRIPSNKNYMKNSAEKMDFD